MKKKLSHQLVRTARDAVNKSDSLLEVEKKNPYKNKNRRKDWWRIAVFLWDVATLPEREWNGE